MPREVVRETVPGQRWKRTRIKDAASVPGVEIIALSKSGVYRKRSAFQIAREDLDEWIAALQTMRNLIDADDKI